MSWIKDVVKAAKSRERAVGNRERGNHSLSLSIISAKRQGVNPIIAELKLASPSGFRYDIDARKYVKYVESAGAIGLSVITEPIAFKGSYGILREASSLVKVPVLMKDFVVTEGQVRDAYVLGADAVLLIVSIIGEEETLKRLYNLVHLLGMEALVEVHSEKDLNIASGLKPRIVGVNARDLLTLRIDYQQQERILSALPGNIIKIAESGIESCERISKLKS
ncbi:MAG: indole-3-glycerol phosphate synthase TrpC, partial [Conexivisphaerales archaeon]